MPFLGVCTHHHDFACGRASVNGYKEHGYSVLRSTRFMLLILLCPQHKSSQLSKTPNTSFVFFEAQIKILVHCGDSRTLDE